MFADKIYYRIFKGFIMRAKFKGAFDKMTRRSFVICKFVNVKSKSNY
jgi:hypothetical protein